MRACVRACVCVCARVCVCVTQLILSPIPLFSSFFLLSSNRQVFLVRKKTGKDAGTLYAMKALKKATLKGEQTIWKRVCVLDFWQ